MLAELLKDLNLPAPIGDVLLGRAKPGDALGLVLQIVRAYETARWDDMKRDAEALQLTLESVPGMYLEAVQWADAAMKAA